MDENKNVTPNTPDTENSTIFTDVHADAAFDKKTKKSGKSVGSKKTVKTIIALLLVAVVLGGGMFAMNRFWPVISGDVEETTTESSLIYLTNKADIPLDQMKNVPSGAISNVSSVTVKNAHGSFTVVPYKIVKATDDGAEDSVDYIVRGYDGIPQSFSSVNGVVETIMNVIAQKKLGGEWDDASCGLDKPLATVNVKMADGSAFSYTVGKKVPNGENSYYAKTSLDDGIFIVTNEYFDTFDTTVLDYVDTNLMSAFEETSATKDYFVESTLCRFDDIKMSGTHLANPIHLEYHSSGEDSLLYRITEPVLTYADDEAIKTILSPVSGGLSAAGAVCIDPTAADKVKYGLDKPYFEITYKLPEYEHTLKISAPNIKTEGYYCCMIDDVPVIYEMMQDINPFIEWDLKDIRSAIQYARKIELIDKMKIDFDGKSTLYDISYDKVPAATSSTDKTAETVEDEYKINVVSNAARVDTKSFQTCYQNFILVRPTEYMKVGDSAPGGNAKLTVTFINTDKSIDVAKFTKYNDRYYLYTINGVGDGLVKYDVLESLINNYRDLRNGKTVK